MSRPKMDAPSVAELFRLYGERRPCKSGEILFEKGTPARYVGYLLSGQIRTLVMNFEGDELTLFYLGPDNILCSEALALHSVVVVTVQAVTDGEVCLLRGEEFLRLWQENGLPLHELLAHYSRKLTLLSDYICCAHFQENDKRIAYFLYTSTDGPENYVSYTNEQIGKIVGAGRVSVNRVLNRFAREGLLRLGYRHIEILDRPGLREVFNGLGYFLDG